MIEYIPWSKNVLNHSIKIQKKGGIPTLDLELTAKCSGACCIYCDSKPDVSACGMLNETKYPEIEKLVLDSKKKGLEWVYTCGLGEPLEDGKFWDMIHLFKANGIKLSMFSNGIFIRDINIAKELKENGVHIILKMDTFEEDKFDIILGRKGAAKQVYAARDLLLEAGYAGKRDYTDLAFSIVPTSLSIDGIPTVIDFAKKHGIFASVGELEQAGEVVNKNLTGTLGIQADTVKHLKTIADAYIEGNYMRPICPCILTGLHIDNLGNCLVDEDTGLNCKWFLLQDPRTVALGNIYDNTAEELIKKVTAYRKMCFDTKKEQIERAFNVSYVFGGCGGNPRDIIALVKQMI